MATSKTTMDAIYARATKHLRHAQRVRLRTLAMAAIPAPVMRKVAGIALQNLVVSAPRVRPRRLQTNVVSVLAQMRAHGPATPRLARPSVNQAKTKPCAEDTGSDTENT